jgi:hypothetical protein
MRRILSSEERWNLASIPILFIIGSFFHFLYGLTNNSPIMGAVSAVNESVWEHQKMVLLPIICYWIIYYIVKGRKNEINRRRWFSGLAISLIVSILTMPFVFYFYTEAFGVEFLIVDILNLLVAIAVGQLVGFHFYKHSQGIPFYASILVVVLIFAVFIIFTFNPPELPWFKDGSTGKYGVW